MLVLDHPERRAWSGTVTDWRLAPPMSLLSRYHNGGPEPLRAFGISVENVQEGT
jgi:hypothetical protein